MFGCGETWRNVQIRKILVGRLHLCDELPSHQTITKNGKTYRYLVRQTNVRKGKKVYSIIEHICGFGMAMLSPGRPGGSSGHRPTDKGQIKLPKELHTCHPQYAEPPAAIAGSGALIV